MPATPVGSKRVSHNRLVDDFSIRHGDASSPVVDLLDDDDDNDKQSKINRSTDLYLKKALLVLLYSTVLIGGTLFAVNRFGIIGTTSTSGGNSGGSTSGGGGNRIAASDIAAAAAKDVTGAAAAVVEQQRETEPEKEEKRQVVSISEQRQQQQQHEQEHQLPDHELVPHIADHSEIWHLHTKHPLLQYLTTPQRTDDDYWIYQDTILAQVVQEADLLVRQKKRTPGVIMETDPEGQTLIKNLQALTKQILLHRYSWAPDQFHTFRVLIEVLLPKTVPDYDPTTDSETHTIVVQLAPKDLVPCSVFYMLELIRTFQRSSVHRNAGHVLQVEVQSLATKGHISMPFQEYNPEFPHKKYTTGYAGRPSGPGWYFSIQDNTKNHGPGSQQKANPYEADSIWGQVVMGHDIIQRIHTVPQNGWLDDENKIHIQSMRLMVPIHPALVTDPNVPSMVMKNWKDFYLPVKNVDVRNGLYLVTQPYDKQLDGIKVIPMPDDAPQNNIQLTS
mmetsp:Transcript_51266/g.123766  ORF Transcript_51266/g.123766 Transcript_51266/m.123766 type:complete len:502 (-) Transcript_51266:150-1655(-)